MKRHIKIPIFAFILLFSAAALKAQDNFHKKIIAVYSDTVSLDTLSIVPGSVLLYHNKNKIDTSLYKIDNLRGNLILNSKALLKKNIYHLTAYYRTFPMNLTQKYYHKNIGMVQTRSGRPKNPFAITYNDNNASVFDLGALNKNGSISRGISFGNNQDLSVNSNLNLQVSGKVTNDINLQAAISDNNLPIQPEGNTQQLQQFDNVFIKFYNEYAALTAGDFVLKNPDSYFMKFNKRAQGGNLAAHFYTGKAKDVKDKGKVDLQVSGAVSKGKYARNIIPGVEGNQGPYQLKGADGESFIVVLAGTEKVYIDGKLLKRGQDFDYTIDYNAAQLTFTPNQLITKNSRIIVEFQYSSQNYARTLFYTSGHYQKKKFNLNVNFYNEQDSKNQPLQQDLDSAQKSLLASIGDSLNQAIVSTAKNKGFDNSQVRYKKVFMPGYDTVFVYSTDSDSAVYQVEFSLVGANKGDYIQTQSIANGRVFQWIAPIAGIPQGNYAPITILITPKKTQMLTVNTDFYLGKQTHIFWQGAMTNYDLNTFSNSGNDDDIGLAARLKIDNNIALNKKKIPTKFIDGVSAEFADERFHPIEHYRSVEFSRDWNIRDISLAKQQIYATAFAGLSKKEKGKIVYTASLLNVENQFNGFKNDLNLQYDTHGFDIAGLGSYLNSSGAENTDYLKQHLGITKNLGKKIKVTGYEEQEQNLFHKKNNDSLLGNSYQWNILKGGIAYGDSLSNSIGATYQYREDLLPFVNRLKLATISNDISLNFNLNKSKYSKLQLQTTYRKLQVIDSLISQNKPEETVLGKLNYDLRLLKGTITSSTYYQIGSGLEIKTAYQYLKVADGQGVYAWTDYNGDGVEQLNEFSVAAFKDEADYIRIFTPTNEYVKVYTNQFNELFYLNPSAIWYNKKGFRKMLSRFSDKVALAANRKTGKRTAIYNPFLNELNDTALVSLNTSFVNSFYFNQNSSKFGMEYDFAQRNGKSISVNGAQSAFDKYNSVRMRLNLTRSIFIKSTYKIGEKGNHSDISTTSSYQYNYSETSPELGFQPNTKARITLKYTYKEKKNEPEFGNQTAFLNNAGVDFRYNIPSKGSITGGFNAIYIVYNSLANTAIAYEMLEGLQPGQNFTWNLGWQQNISKNLQMNILYSGRKSKTTKIIHTGSVQIRAFF